MYGIKQEFASKTWVTNTANNSLHCTTGIVVAINEYENTCDIDYPDKDNKRQILHNVSVKSIGGDNWFPELGEEVQLEDFNDNRPVIVASEDGDWISRKREKQWDNLDIMALTTCGISGFVVT